MGLLYSLGGYYIASEVKLDLRFEISNINYLHVHIAYMVWTFLVASEATRTSKQPRRAKLTSDLEFVAQIAYATMFFGLLRPSLEVSKKIKKETDNHYTCVALRAWW